jgi:guanine deaminase
MHLLTGQTFSFTEDPAIVGEERSFRHHCEGALVVGDDGTIAWSGEQTELPKEYSALPRTDHGEALIMPGFVDAHLHFPQYRMIAAYGKDLLDWLERYTFPEEMKYGDPAFAAAAADKFVAEMFRNGTTSCLAFSTIHPEALDALFSAAQRQSMAMISGKTMMDCNAPSGLTDTPQAGYDQSKMLIDKWHGVDRLQYAITPRFAFTSSQALMEAVGALKREYPDLVLQTHLSENHSEIAGVANAFPWAKDYTDVYDRFGLLSEKAFFAHGIHLSDRELLRMSETGAAIVHCPTSNNFLGSGLFRFRDTRQGKHAVAVGIGSDIGGGTSYSMLATMRDAYIVSQLVGARISPLHAFYTASLGNARLMHLDHEIGTLADGKIADLVVLDPQATPVMAERHQMSQSLSDVLFALMIMGDDRAVRETWVAGRRVKGDGKVIIR